MAPDTSNPPNSQLKLHNVGIMCYFIYWVIQFPFMLVSVQKIRWLFFAKALIVPPSWIALLIWAFVKVPASSGLFNLHATATGSEFSWAYLMALNASLGAYATLAVNIPDFTVCCFRISVILGPLWMLIGIPS